MKKFIIVLCISILLILVGCSKETTKIGILIYDENDTFISELEEYLTENMPKDMTYEINYASNSQFIQNQQLLTFLDEGIDILLINAVDRLAGATIVEKCEKKGVPVIFFNREPLESDIKDGKDIYYVGADADNLGIKQADIVSDLFGPPTDLIDTYDKNNDGIIQTVIIKGEQGHQDAEKRTRNVIERLQNLEYEVDLLSTRVANWRRTEGFDVMEELYLEFGDSIELVLSNNDDMALGAIDYFLEASIFAIKEAENFNQPIVVIGVDGTKTGLEAIDKGLMYGSVLNDADKQSQAIIKLVEYINDKKDMSDFPFVIKKGHYIYIDGEIILKTNELNS